jgi:hypothetical protein
MFDIIPIDPIIFLIFAMPGFFFLKVLGIKFNSQFDQMMLSLFWGGLLMVLYYRFIPIEKFNSFIENPYSGAIIFSLITIGMVFLIKFFISLIKDILNPY